MDEISEGHTVREIQTGPFARRISDSLKQIVITLVREGHFIIIDDVPVEQAHLDGWKEALHNFCVLYVGMSACVDLLERRERQRGNRILGAARAYFLSSSMHFGYDLAFDTGQQHLPEQVEIIRVKVCG